jgi:DNA-binding transcriptional regulator GbsR (MarR family)
MPKNTAKDKLRDKFRKNVYLMPDEYLNGWAKKCGWKASLVYNSLWRHADRDGRSFPSIELMAKQHGVSENTIRRGLKTLVDFNLVIREEKRDSKGKFIHNIYTLTDKLEWKVPKESTAPTERWVTERASTAPTGTIHRSVVKGKGTHNKGTHIKKEIYKERKKYSSIKDITPQDLQEIALRYKVSVGFVSLQFEKLRNYCEAKGKVYRNYKSALRNFVLGDMQRQIQEKQSGGDLYVN